MKAGIFSCRAFSDTHKKLSRRSRDITEEPLVERKTIRERIRRNDLTKW